MAFNKKEKDWAELLNMLARCGTLSDCEMLKKKRLNYGKVSVLLDQKVRVGGLAELKVHQGKDIYVFYLMTKVLYHHKPAPESLASALNQLRDRLSDLSINLLIIPKLGCALDGLNWHEVRGMLHSTFVDGKVQITVCDPENFQIPRHVIAGCKEKKVEFLECGGPETLMILPVELLSASENAMFKKCLDHFRLSPSLIDNGRWASVAKGQMVRGNNSFIIWAIMRDDINFFQTLETQIDDTRVMVPNSSIWAFPKSEIINYAEFISLIRSKLADNVQKFNVVVCDPTMPTQTMHAGKWPRINHHRPSPVNHNPVQGGRIVRGRGQLVRGSGQLVRGRGEVMRGGYFNGRGGYGEHSSTPSTEIYADALDTIGRTLTSIVSVVQMATQSTNPQPAPAELSWRNDANYMRGRARGWERGRPTIICHICREFGHTRQYCPNG